MAYTEDEARLLVVRAGRRLLEAGLAARTWGNVSARLSDTHFVITPSGEAYEDLRPERLVRVRIADGSYTGKVRPSSERGIHADAIVVLGASVFANGTPSDILADRLEVAADLLK